MYLESPTPLPTLRFLLVKPRDTKSVQQLVMANLKNWGIRRRRYDRSTTSTMTTKAKSACRITGNLPA